MFSVDPRTVRHWESGRNAAPKDRLDDIKAIDAHIDFLANEAFNLYHKTKPEKALLYRFKNHENLLEAMPNFEWPINVHAVMLYRTKKLFDQKGIPVSIEYAD